MKTVGVTGGIGAGKSTVCKIFSTLGIPIYQADDRAKFLMQHNPALRQALINAFGQKTFLDGELNRPYLAKIVFSDSSQTKIINHLVHPVVAEDFEFWVSQQKSPYVIKEAALMIESSAYKSLDMLINVTSPISLRIERIKKRDPLRSIEEIEGIIDKQLSDAERAVVSDETISNDDSSLLIPQVLKIDGNLRG